MLLKEPKRLRLYLWLTAKSFNPVQARVATEPRKLPLGIVPMPLLRLGDRFRQRLAPA